jgi:cystathionine beta-lyase family protein involved in aluminum resistance
MDVDTDAIRKAVSKDTKVVALQRSTGYDWRPAISLESLRKVTELVHGIDPGIIVMLDNCYGEFVDITEPTEFGVDVMAGSLIKNPGGGLALSGGYIVGRADLIEQISYRLTCPGIGAECGLTFGQNRNVLQGLFIAPRVVNSALKGALLAGNIYDSLGFEVMPAADAKRSDIIQAIKFASPERTVEFCKAIQAAAPIDSYVSPEPWDMPGYADQVVMAAGAFVQGSSIELSADSPIREPYIAYFQGGLTYEHSRYGIIRSLDSLYKKGMIELD